MKPEHLLDKHCKKYMGEWSLKRFEKTHPTLLKCITEAIKEAQTMNNFKYTGEPLASAHTVTKHKILVELDRFKEISAGNLRHHILHRSYEVKAGDLACFHVSGISEPLEFCTEVLYVDNDMPGIGRAHFIISFKLL